MAEKLLLSSCTSSRNSSSAPHCALAVPRRATRHRSSSSSSVRSSCSSSSAGVLRAPALFLPRDASPSPSGRAPVVTCLFNGEKRDAARRALESALGEKKEVFSKWDEEIKKREASGGGGSKGRGRGWGGGGSGGGDDSPSESSGSENQWGEAIQVVYAFAGLAGLYLVLTKGSVILAFVLNCVLYVSRGFKSRPTPRYAPAANQLPGDAVSHVKNKWGSDD